LIVLIFAVPIWMPLLLVYIESTNEIPVFWWKIAQIVDGFSDFWQK